jgi:antitoxin VapB
MDTAKLFRNGRSQAVRLPKEYALPGDEVYVKKIEGVLVLIPKSKDRWDSLAGSLELFSDDFLESGREQGQPESRERLE